MTQAELLEELRRDCPTLYFRIGDPEMSSVAEACVLEILELINRHRAEAHELGRNEERPRDAIDM